MSEETVPKRKRTHYSRELKDEICKLNMTGSYTHKELGEKFQVPANLISKWVRLKREEGDEAFRGNGNRRALEAENTRLKKENEELKQEREILKKASAYFAKHQR